METRKKIAADIGHGWRLAMTWDGSGYRTTLARPGNKDDARACYVKKTWFSGWACYAVVGAGWELGDRMFDEADTPEGAGMRWGRLVVEKLTTAREIKPDAEYLVNGKREVHPRTKQMILYHLGGLAKYDDKSDAELRGIATAAMNPESPQWLRTKVANYVVSERRKMRGGR